MNFFSSIGRKTGSENKGVNGGANNKGAMDRGYDKSKRSYVNFGGRKDIKYNKGQNRNAVERKVKIIPLGGLDEIGKNTTVIEYEDEMIIVDCGMAFPDHEMLGVDIVIPDYSYIKQNVNKVKGIFVTHGHEDHIGGLAYLFKDVGQLPVYGSDLTLGLIEGKLKEHKMLGGASLNVVKPGDVIKLKNISVEFISVNHSIPAACGLAIKTPAGTILHTGDFKIDYTPINGSVINLSRFAELGDEGVLALMSDSTNSERIGMTVSESKIGESFQFLFKRAQDQRIIIATFASNIHRIQQIMDVAVETGRKVAVSGRSMETVVAKAIELGYLKIKKGTLVSIDNIKNYRDDQIIVVTTGSQGEPMSALKRMSTGDHKKVSITSNDFIIISANPIPGNEKFINKVINELMKLGAQVIYEDMYDVHVSGHACQDEQKMIINLVKPKYFLPVHGEYKHLKRHAETAIKMGISKDNVHIGSIGEVIELSRSKMHVSGVVQSGNVMVDGNSVGDVGNVVLRDRKILSEDGLVFIVLTIDRMNKSVVAGPDVVSRGFVYVKESEELIYKIKKLTETTVEQLLDNGVIEWSPLKLKVKDAISDYLYSATKRRPMILVVIQSVN